MKPTNPQKSNLTQETLTQCPLNSKFMCYDSGFHCDNKSRQRFDNWSAGKLLEIACENVPGEYIHIKRHKQTEHYRERAYCYELYHQMRCLWPLYGTEGLVLNGELDKDGHKIFAKTCISKAKPDFLIHKPGCPESNHTIIEVKMANSSASGWRKDIATLYGFMKVVGYKHAIFLVAGSCGQNSRIKTRLVKNLSCNPLNITNSDHLYGSIQIWHHSGPGEKATCIDTLGNL